jgi:uncharacterized delta-60 repeat protein
MKNFTLIGLVDKVAPLTRRRRTTRARQKLASTARLNFEPLEARQLLSGFGPADGAYVVAPWGGTYKDVQVQSGDQKIVAAGYETDIKNPDGTTDYHMAIARYDSAGNTDSSYGIGGVSAPPLGPGIETGYGLVLQPTDGKAVVSGSSSAPGGLIAARFTTSGTPDSSFGSGGWTTLDARPATVSYAYAVGLQSTGKLVTAGVLFPYEGNPMEAEVARFTASGTLDSGKGGFGEIINGKATGYVLTAFGGLTSSFFDLAVQSDDKLVAVGMAYTNAGSPRLVVARYTASGVLDTTFNGTGYSVLLPPGSSTSRGSSVALQSNGQIIVTGGAVGSDGAPDLVIARYNQNGTLDTSFGGGGTGYVMIHDGAESASPRGSGVVIDPNGNIVVEGNTKVDGNPGSVLVARFTPNGTLDPTFGTGGIKLESPPPNNSFAAEGVALESNGNIIVAGSDSGYPLLMRFFGGSTAPALKVSGGAAGSAGVAQVSSRLPNTVAFDTGGATASLSTDAPGVGTALVVKRNSKGVPSVGALPAPGTAAATVPKTVAQALDPILVLQILDDHPFLNTLITGNRRRSI